MGWVKKVVLNCVTSAWGPITSVVLLGSILEPVRLNIIINDLDAGLDDAELGRVEALERELENLEGWVITKHMKFNLGKCEFCTWDGTLLGPTYLGCTDRYRKVVPQKGTWGSGQWQVEHESAVPWQPGGPTLSWGTSGTASPARKDIEELEHVQGSITEPVKGLEQKFDEEQLRELGLSSLEKRRFKGEISTCT
ncbi:hypothetical protein DUI87_07852 [Hirundo rustica rustica]|uniref:Reverse transcriptase domain-containing protein n=1 Tax=Hirundo rustica rustica TaxID=333673 RepID=A0A3M0KY17_HIRRU|nr:hypothetical protein DUI87_07852 [Hirundo rustica rustica]